MDLEGPQGLLKGLKRNQLIGIDPDPDPNPDAELNGNSSMESVLIFEIKCSITILVIKTRPRDYF